MRFLLWVPALLLATALPSSADTIRIHNSEPLKGLIVEEHEDRVVLSTGDGEKMVFRTDIQEIEYDEPEYSFLNLGRDMERSKKWGEAKSYFDKAYELNPNLVEARQAALAIQSRLWAKAIDEGPREEMSKQQVIEDAYRANVDVDGLAKAKADRERDLWQRLGLKLETKGDWAAISNVLIGGKAYKWGLRSGDELAGVDGRSLRYLNSETVVEELLEPRYSNGSLSIGRRVSLEPKPGRSLLKMLGVKIRQQYNGLTVENAGKKSPFKKGDLIVEIAGQLTRYLPTKKAQQLIDDGKAKVDLKINRTFSFTRN